jgi:hypothetical protein
MQQLPLEMGAPGTMLFLKGIGAMSDKYSLRDVLERIYQNQLGLEAALWS